jgi:hypothetical protein
LEPYISISLQASTGAAPAATRTAQTRSSHRSLPVLQKLGIATKTMLKDALVCVVANAIYYNPVLAMQVPVCLPAGVPA